MASSLLSSPPEILSMVFAYLDWTDHLALALTHRTLRPLADSILYSRIKWAWYSPWTPPIQGSADHYTKAATSKIGQRRHSQGPLFRVRDPT
jgi:hypothetical protein